MRLAIRTASRLPRPWIGQAFTAAPPAALRYSSNIPAGNTEDTSAENTSADDFVKQVVGTTDNLGTRDDEDKKSSSNVAKKANSRHVFRKVKFVPPRTKNKKAKRSSPSLVRKVRLRAEEPMKPIIMNTAFPLIRKATVESPEPWQLPARLWPEKPAAVFPCRGLLTLRGLPLETTLKDIVLAIDHAARDRKVSRRAALTADIVIKHSLDKSTEVDAVVDFMHPDGAKHLHDLVKNGEFKVLGVVPTASLDDPKDTSKVPQASEGDEVIAQLSKVDRAEYFTSPEQRKVVRRTHLIYN